MKPRYKLDKRQKELARKQKQDRKKEAKVQRAQPGASTTDAGGDAIENENLPSGTADADDKDPEQSTS